MRGISLRKYSRRSAIRKSISVLGRRQFSTENAYSVSASIFNRAQVSIVVRADCVPERCPAILGRCRFCAQRPFPSMMTATCLGSRVKSNFSSRRASSGVTGPSEPGTGTCSVLCILVCGNVVRKASPKSSLRRKVNTRNLIESCGVDVFPHQVAPVYQQQNKDHGHRQPDPVAHLRKDQNLPKRRAWQENYARTYHDQNGIKRVEDARLAELAIDTALKPEPLANHMSGGKRENGGREERSIEEPKGE